MTLAKLSHPPTTAMLWQATIPPVLVIRWVGWVGGPLVPVYAGAESPPEVPLLGVMVADAEALRVMGELLDAWAETRSPSHGDSAP